MALLIQYFPNQTHFFKEQNVKKVLEIQSLYMVCSEGGPNATRNKHELPKNLSSLDVQTTTIRIFFDSLEGHLTLASIVKLPLQRNFFNFKK